MEIRQCPEWAQRGVVGLQAFCDLPSWCEGCPNFEPDVSPIFMDNTAGGLNVSCIHRGRCIEAAKRARTDWARWVRVKDCPPPSGKIVLVAMSRDGLWYPRWGKYIDGHWAIVIRPGSEVCLSDYDLDWWMPLEPPTGDLPTEDPAVEEASP